MKRLIKQIRQREAVCRAVHRRLRLAGIDARRRGGSWGFDVPGIVNPRTGSEWHSVGEAIGLLREKTA